MFDILIFALITLFFGYKLYVSLGRTSDDDTEHNPIGKNNHDNSKIVRKFPQANDINSEDTENKPAYRNHSKNVALSREEKDLEHLVQKIEPDFSMRQFKKGAEKAFRMIVEGFAEGDKKVLSKLLSEEMFQTFETDIDVREEANNIRETQIESINHLRIKDVSVDNTYIRILVEIESTQIVWEQDENDNTIEGDEDLQTVILDTWVFGRDTNSSSPAWLLETTNVE